ncbi:MAG: bifunctional phosphoglucose/phosphomannose isomerase [Methanomassiliicoccaceae archaeon]|jgi:glucose/mannose-6-phosphate isomerase|nr:bifunctional phosphoglucose/phosphomannose isomerase [Methanomassiliicoccaceae archaeon]
MEDAPAAEERTRAKVFTDPADMPEQIESALNMPLMNIAKKPKVCICGMGASAMAGEIMSDFADASSDVPISVVRGAELPRWVDEHTAVIAISYSGNTPETLRLYDQAASRGCDIICITSGGELMERAAGNDNPLITMPSGLIPRNALGYMLGLTASVFEEMGICASRSELRSLLPSLREFRDDILKDETNNKAVAIACRILGKIPVIYSLVNLRAAAIRWKMQISENSRTIAFCGTIPEFSHNEIVGWADDYSSDEFILIMLIDDDPIDVLRCMTETLSSVLVKNGIKPYEFKVKGINDLEKNLRAIILGDLVSIYLAKLKGVYPGEICLDLGDGGRREFN